VGGLALLLAIVLFFLPWFHVSVFGASFSSTATGDPDSWCGILAAIVVVALIADLAFDALSPQTQLPMIGGSRAATRFFLTAIAAAFLLLKFLLQISHFSNLGFGFWAAVVLVGGLLFATLRLNQGRSILPTA
jgi:ABC-type xylose transport system permease subunit